jgi:hypothetical protein
MVKIVVRKVGRPDGYLLALPQPLTSCGLFREGKYNNKMNGPC